jgi:cell wall-associated NlpC family hydrolase
MRFAACCVAFTTFACTAQARPIVREGDIIFQTSQSSQSAAIQKATHSPYSHMGLILYQGGKPFVFEAARTVKYTPLDDWVRRGAGAHFVVKRLKQAPTLLTPAALRKLHQEAGRFEGRPYDLTFEWSDSRLYCSELVWKIYQRALGVRVGRLQRLREFDLSDPVVLEKMQERYGSDVPLDELVISPSAMFDWTGLETVAQK